jgi:hypothetical protein
VSDLVRSILEQRERRLSGELVQAISGWLDGERELGRSPQPSSLFYRYVPQVSGAALEQRSGDLLRLALKAHLRSAGWVHDPRREFDEVGLTLPFWICQQIGIDPYVFLWDVAAEFGAEVAQLVEGQYPAIERTLAKKGGPTRRNRYVAVRLVGGRGDFEPCWDFDQHEREVDYVKGMVEMLIDGVGKVRELEGPEAAERMVRRTTHPELEGMTWFGGLPAPEGMAIWEDVDALAGVRADLDRIVVTGAAAVPPPAELVGAYVREKATSVARHGSEESLRQGLAAALLGEESLVALLGHAVWYFEGPTGAARVDRAIRELPPGLAEGRALRGEHLVRDVLPGGVVLTGLYTGLKYSDPFV